MIAGFPFPRILHRLHRSVSSPASSPAGASHTWLAAAFGWPPPNLDPARETAWLDGLRGLAALLVMAYHYHLTFWGVTTEAPYGAYGSAWELWRLPILRVFMCAGHAQVSVFFVLSGFVLSWASLGLLRKGRAEKLAANLASATLRRWTRLFLPCIVVASFALIEAWCGFISMPGGTKETVWLQIWDFLKATERFADPLYIDRKEDHYRHEYNWTMWTIPIEYRGSLLVFLLLLIVSRMRDYTRRTLVLGAACLLCMLKARWDYWLFSYGILLADYIQERGGFLEADKNVQKAAWIAVLIVSLLLAGVPENSPFYSNNGYEFLESYVPSNWREIESGRRFWWCWAGVFFVTAACHLAATRRFFSLPALRYLGRISYMLYVTHRIVWEVFGRFFKEWTAWPLLHKEWNEEWGVYLWHGSGFCTFIVLLLCWLVVGPLAIFVAHWCEVLIDRPCVELARRLDRSLTNGFAYQTVPHKEEVSQLPV